MAVLAASRAVDATGEFRKILNERALVWSDPAGATARLQIGRALLVTRDTEKARHAYQEFLTLWRDADLDLPILKADAGGIHRVALMFREPRSYQGTCLNYEITQGCLVQ